jgi:hypothetical protein
MKLLLAAAALLASGAAIAQPATTQRDARGIPVENAEPNVPAGVNQRVDAPPGTEFRYSQNQQAAFASRPATGEYPACQAGQTDRCTQTYEGRRSGTRARRGRR